MGRIDAMPSADPTGRPAAITTHELTRRFGNLTAVDRLTLSVPSRSIFGLLGTNGAGKSTVIKMLTTLLPPTSGTASVAGYDIVGEPESVRRHVGYVPQMLSADGELTGYENLLISAKLYGIPRAERSARIDQALEFMELGSAAHRPVGHYSGGMIRRLEIAQSMLHRPTVLFLDEPTLGLDPNARHAVWQRVQDLRAEFQTTILLTTHDMEEADHLCESVAFMHRGRFVREGTPAALKAEVGADATLDEVFVRITGASSEDRGEFREVKRTRRTVQRLG